ncbi:hypothetical protein [Halarchaeum nitratireducens]|uniref:Uncharacterized protein n=1 Tax=Halarchaeum nitratireducens TaxID=489913 RepID=A0A830GFI9_9EURY|nr:hypothetical protein [Halarchaeum nitratireducens]GGN26085.1 hypothetical protein GCM10009021_30300 [Halarchaeum nitratireducens]
MSLEPIFDWLQEWSQVIAGLGSLFLTGGLVYLYRQQQGLLKRELNREVRNSHTDTLRKRIRSWHGDIDELGVSDDAGFFSDNTNLPRVHGASVQPAPALIDVVGRDTEFRVVPQAIEDDRYLQDLLENHAPELKQIKEEIEQRHREFEDKKAQFRNEFPEAPSAETDDYTLTSTQYFDLWVFKSAVKLHREHLESDKERLRAIAEDSVENETSARPDPAIVSYSADARGGSKVITYEAQLKSGDLDVLSGLDDEIKEQVLELYYDAIEDIDSEGVYSHAVEAAEILDKMAETIEELKAKLVEYEGHPLYMGDCEYLEEATL